MPHEDFFEAIEIKSTCWENNVKKTLVSYHSFEDVPKYLQSELEETEDEITLKGKTWKILDIDKNLRAHGKGMQIRIRLEQKT